MIGAKIKGIRRDKGLTQKQLGEKSGIAESTIRRYELGSLNPKIETLQKIAQALEVPLRELFISKNIDGSTVIDLTSIDEQDVNLYMTELFHQKNTKEGNKLFHSDTNNKQLVTIHADDVLSLTDEEYNLLRLYNELNVTGKKEAVKRVSELTEIERYTKKDEE